MAGMTSNVFYGSSRQKHGQGGMSFLRAERLLNAITNDSEIEDLSDGEEDDPAVGEIAPCEATVEQPDDSDSDYQPDAADISEDTDSDVSEPQHKQQHLENDEPDQDVQGRRAGPRNGNREYWKSAPFNPVLVPFQGADEQQDERADMSPVQYMEQYVDIELMKVLADCTNSMSLVKSGRSLNTSVEEMYHFFGASILMSCIPYPQIRMFWSTNLRVPAISDTMRRDRFFKLRSHLKVVIDDDIPEDRKTDKFWKVRPFMNRILKGCHAQARPESVSIGEQMIPFTGGCPFRQYVPLKPNPVGMKNFVLATADGVVLDFEVYQGSMELAAQVLDAEGLGLGALVLKRLTKTVHPGTKVYCDRFFTTTSAAESMLEKQVYLTGTVMKNRIPKAMQKLPSDKIMKQQGRGTSASVVRGDGKLNVVKWFDNKPVLMLSAVHTKEPENTCQRWSKKNKCYLTIRRPNIVQEYNAKMGGVDLSDRMMSYYRMSVRTKKWTIRMLMHFMDLALANSWLLYRRDHQEHGTPRKAIMTFLAFRMDVAQVFLNKCDVTHAEEESACCPQPGQRSLVTPIPHISKRTASAAHLPEVADLKNPMRCRQQGCPGKSRVRCLTCNVFLCLQSRRNCYEAFHGDVQQVLVVKEELVVEEEDWSPRPDQEDQKPPQIKEEEEENEITGLTFSPVHVKSEDEEEIPQLSELLPSQTEGNRDSEESDDDKTSNCSSETDVSDGNWEESEAQSGLDSVKKDAVPVGDRKCGKSKKLHICPDCGKTFRSRQGLLGHHRIHTGENPFSCSICNKTFSSKGNLQKHSKVHTGERPFKCSVCGTALKSKNALIEHTRIHTGEKPFNCSICGRSFSFRSYLTVHMKCHSEEKPYSCSLCTAAFKRKNVLLAHVKTHTGEKPYSCSVCGKNFAHCVSLTCHMRSHTGERPYSCSICKATFKWKNTFTHHIKIHTDE